MTASKQSQDGTAELFHPDSAWIISASGWLLKNKSIMMHGNMNVNKYPLFYGTVYRRLETLNVD